MLFFADLKPRKTGAGADAAGLVKTELVALGGWGAALLLAAPHVARLLGLG